MKKFILIVLIGVGVYLYRHYGLPTPVFPRPEVTAEGRFNDSDSFIKNACENRKQGVPVQGQGIVTAVLPDRGFGGRYRRFAVRLASGHMLTVEHTCEASQRLEALQEGESIEFSGVYDWDTRGGTVKRTHRDPKNRHAPGWIRHQGQTYQ